jgi:F0F1-type ATP synthase membrane subunit b/b'
MNINATFFVELFIFGMFYYFVKVCIWPRFAGVLEERRSYIENGLAASKDGHNFLKEAQKEAENILKRANLQAKEILQNAHVEMNYLKDKVQLEMDEFRLSIQKESLIEREQMRELFATEARAHYLVVAKEICEKIFEDHSQLLQQSLETKLVIYVDKNQFFQQGI